MVFPQTIHPKSDSLLVRQQVRKAGIITSRTNDCDSEPQMIHIYDKKGFTKLFSHNGESFKGLDLSKAVLKEANMIQMDLREVNLSHVDLSNADLRMANLTSANLSNANLVGADLDGAITDGCDMTGAILVAPASADENGNVAVLIDSIGKRSS